MLLAPVDCTLDRLLRLQASVTGQQEAESFVNCDNKVYHTQEYVLSPSYKI